MVDGWLAAHVQVERLSGLVDRASDALSLDQDLRLEVINSSANIGAVRARPRGGGGGEGGRGGRGVGARWTACRRMRPTPVPCRAVQRIVKFFQLIETDLYAKLAGSSAQIAVPAEVRA